MVVNMREGCDGDSTSFTQMQVDSEEQETFLMQSMLTGVVQQLERIERLVDNVNREGALRGNSTGDRTHVTVEDNFEALKAKLMALSAANRHYQYRFTAGCTNYIGEWIERRPEVKKSQKIAKALISTLDACEGNYQPEVQVVRLDQRTLQDLSERLAYASRRWHEKEEKFSRDKEVYLRKQLVQIRSEQQESLDVSALREDLNETVENSLAGKGESASDEDVEMSDPDAVEHKEEQKQHLDLSVHQLRENVISEFVKLKEVKEKMQYNQENLFRNKSYTKAWNAQFVDVIREYYQLQSETNLPEDRKFFESYEVLLNRIKELRHQAAVF